MTNIERWIAAARHRIHKRIDLKCELANATTDRERERARRRIGQLYKEGRLPHDHPRQPR